jgi:hypothetical protein
MYIIGTNEMIRGNEMGYPICGSLHLHGNPHQFIVGMFFIFLTIILYNYIMHDDTSIHDIPNALLVPKSSMSPHNSQLGLQNPKCYIHIFLSRRLCIVKLSLFLTFGLNNRLHKSFPPWIDAVGKKVVIVVRVAKWLQTPPMDLHAMQVLSLLVTVEEH